MVMAYSKSKDQPGKVANSARRQLNREKYLFPCPRSRLRICSVETGSAIPSRASLLISILRLNVVLTGFLPISAAVSVYTVNRNRVNLEFIRSRNCISMAFIAESPPARGQLTSR